MRNIIDIFSEIHSRQVRGVMFHNETAQMFDFLGLRGYKRQHEYQMLEEIKAQALFRRIGTLQNARPLPKATGEIG